MILKGDDGLSIPQCVDLLAHTPADAVELRFYRCFDDDACTLKSDFGMLAWLLSNGVLLKADTLERWEPTARHKLEVSMDALGGCFQLPAGPPS